MTHDKIYLMYPIIGPEEPETVKIAFDSKYLTEAPSPMSSRNSLPLS